MRGRPGGAAAWVLLTVFLLGSVMAAAWRLFAAWVAATLAFYLAYSMPASYAHHALKRCAHPLNLLNLYWRKTLLFYLSYCMPASYSHHALERCGHPCPNPTH